MGNNRASGSILGWRNGAQTITNLLFAGDVLQVTTNVQNSEDIPRALIKLLKSRR
jgi:hypothetical protein